MCKCIYSLHAWQWEMIKPLFLDFNQNCTFYNLRSLSPCICLSNETPNISLFYHVRCRSVWRVISESLWHQFAVHFSVLGSVN